MPTFWTALEVTVPAAAEEAVAAFLIDLGAPGLVTEDAHGGVVRLTAHFEGDAPLAEVRSFCTRLDDLTPGAGHAQIETRIVTPEAWAENWKSHFPPLCIGERFFIHPPWVQDVPAGRLGVEIDPGMAFGTGQHASTCGCLVLLERVLAEKPSALVLDLGTGSGILAIAAARLGAARIWAVDVDPEACRVAQENVVVNRVDDRVWVCNSLDAVAARCDLVLANLFANQLVALTEPIVQHLRPGGVVIGSGILANEEATVTSAWRGAGLSPVTRHEEAGWVTVACKAGSER
jgi:ribosomal protein L11 methyltransferase